MKAALWAGIAGLGLASAALAARLIWMVLFDAASLMAGRW